MAPTIRTATPDEQAGLEALMGRSSSHWPAYREALAHHPEVIEVGREDLDAGRVRVRHDAAGTLLGFSVLLPPAHGACELDGLFVDPPHMGTGAGRALVEDAAARAGARGASRLEVIGGPEARGFYERVGFVVVEDATTRFGPAWRLVRQL
jgi:GNAT superfamily N-acetyltransferase